jgi:hypothetical protein
MRHRQYGDAMTGTAIRPLTTWLVVLVETIFAGLVVSAIVARTEPPVVGALAALVMLPLGYLATRLLPPLEPIRTRLIVGLVLAFALRLAVTAAGTPTVDAWILGAVVPTVVGLGLWWRGSALATSELTPTDVRNEFLVLGVCLLILLTIFRFILGLSGPGLLLALVVFIGSGLLGVGLARQDGAGSPNAGPPRLLELGSVAALVAIGVLVVGALQPELIAALWQDLGAVLGVIGGLLLLILQPLFDLLAHFNPTLPAAPAGQAPLAPPQPMQPPQGEPPPAWLAWLVLGGAVLIALVVVSVMIAVLLMALSAVSRRGMRGTDSDSEADQEGGAGDDARALLSGLRRWLGRLGQRTAAALPGRRASIQLDSARAAYRALLRWAKESGVERASSETTQQFRRRLDHQRPDGSATYASVTDSYELERYGELPAPRDRLRVLERELEALRESLLNEETKGRATRP